MNKRLLPSALALFCMLALGSCSSQEEDCNCDDTTVEIGFSLSALSTPGRSIGTIPSKNSSNEIKDFQIFVFDEQGFLEKTIYTPASNVDDIIHVQVKTGLKDFYAIANLGHELEGISNKQDLATQVCSIEEQQQPPFLMATQRFGEKVADNGKEHVFTLTVERLASRIRLQYETDFRNTYYEGKEFVVDSVYIIHGNSRCTYSYTQADGSLESSAPKTGRKDENNFLSSFLQTGHWDSTPVGFYSNNYFYFYVFPNANPQAPTKIVLSALLDGERTYYPITVNKPDGKVDWGDSTPHSYIQRNTDYKIRVTLTGEGGKDPNIDIEYVNISLGVSCADWSEAWQEEDFKE